MDRCYAIIHRILSVYCRFDENDACEGLGTLERAGSYAVKISDIAKTHFVILTYATHIFQSTN